MFLGIDYTTTASGAVIKFVQCEQCGGGYAYQMSRQIRASQFSPMALDNRRSAEGSRREAAERLRSALKNSCDPVPCPHCGWYQEAMVQRLRRTRFKWVTQLCIVLLLAPLFLILFLALVLVEHGVVPEEYLGPAAGVIAGTSWGLIPLLLGGRYLLNRRYDPNRKPAKYRVALGRKLSLSERKYARAMEEAERQRREDR